MNPRIEFGRERIATASREWGDYLLLTMPEPYKEAQRLGLKEPGYKFYVQSMDRVYVEKVEKELPEKENIVGLGGGMAIDMAKYIAWKRGIEPIILPSCASVDACVCSSIAVREDHNVKYIGHSVPKVVLVDFDLVQSAPLEINRAGIGDILSIHTAVFDWKLGSEKGIFSYSEEIANKAKDLVFELEELCLEIKTATERGIKWLFEAYARENELCIKMGHSRPEEGAEHYFAYNVEYLTKRHFVHGEVVCLGVFLVSRIQRNEPERIEEILRKTKVRFQPRELGISKDELQKSLLTLRDYVEKQKLPYSVINEHKLDPSSLEAIFKGLKF